MPDLEELRVLVALAEAGSISVAAANLRTSRARMRRKLAALEERTGVQLLARADGVLIPTEPGASLVGGAKHLLDDASLLIAHTREIGTEPAGLLRIAFQPGFPHQVAMPAYELLLDRYNHLRAEVRVAENPVELLPDDADLAITIDEDLDLPGCVRFPIVPLRCQLLATETYLAARGSPATAGELKDHRLLVWRPPSGNSQDLHLREGGHLVVQAAIISSNERILMQMAASHQGMAYVPCPPIPDPEFHELKPVLAETLGRSINVQMYVPNALTEVPRVKAVLDAVVRVTNVLNAHSG